MAAANLSEGPTIKLQRTGKRAAAGLDAQKAEKKMKFVLNSSDEDDNEVQVLLLSGDVARAALLPKMAIPMFRTSSR